LKLSFDDGVFFIFYFDIIIFITIFYYSFAFHFTNQSSTGIKKKIVDKILHLDKNIYQNQNQKKKMLFSRPIGLVVDQNVNGQFLGNALSLKYVNQVTYQICI
jgi:hypothetical protein